MKIQIEAPWEVNAYLENIIQQKLEKLHTFNDQILSANVFFKTGDSHGTDDKISEIRLRLKGAELFAQDNADSFEKSIAGAAEKLRRQLKKLKERQQKH